MKHKSTKRRQRQHYLQMAAIFRDVQKFLRMREYGSGWRFICLAIGILDYDRAQRMAAKAIIHERIAPCTTVEEWLECNVPGVGRDATSVPFETLQDYRIRWLKSLEEEFANKGYYNELQVAA